MMPLNHCLAVWYVLLSDCLTLRFRYGDCWFGKYFHSCQIPQALCQLYQAGKVLLIQCVGGEQVL